MNQRFAGSIPSPGTGLGYGPGPQWGPPERQPHIDVSISFSLHSPLSLKKKKERKKKKRKKFGKHGLCGFLELVNLLVTAA